VRKSVPLALTSLIWQRVRKKSQKNAIFPSTDFENFHSKLPSALAISEVNNPYSALEPYK